MKNRSQVIQIKEADKVKYLLEKNYFNKYNNILEAYYYLTNDKYKNLPKFNIRNNNRNDDKKYYKALLKEVSFYLFYEWIG